MSELFLLDTNLLVYALDKRAPFHEESKAIRDSAFLGDIGGCVCPQILFELYSVITNPKYSSNPVTLRQAVDELDRYHESPFLTIILPPMDILPVMSTMLRAHPVKSRDIFDIHIVATMLANEVRKIYTYDTAIFSLFKEIEIIRPGSLSG